MPDQNIMPLLLSIPQRTADSSKQRGEKKIQPNLPSFFTSFTSQLKDNTSLTPQKHVFHFSLLYEIYFSPPGSLHT